MFAVTTTHYLVVSFLLFAIGIFGIASRTNQIALNRVVRCAWPSSGEDL